jgi:hypothetical protein
MPALKVPAADGAFYCFVHNPANERARKAAAARGGSKRGRAIPPPQLPPSAARFDLGRLEDAGDVAPALLRVSRAIAGGQIDGKMGRLLTESLRVSARAFEASPPRAGSRRGWDTLTDEEIEYIVINKGKLPPGRTLEELDKTN